MSDRHLHPSLRRDHPVFFWGMVSLVLLFTVASGIVAARIPEYRRQAGEIDGKMSQAERGTRDRILHSEAKRSDLALALFQRELRVREMEQEGLHLAIDTQDSTLYLRQANATLRSARIRIGADSVVHAPDGRSWRFVRALGERRLQDKEKDPVYVVPEWVYVSRGEPVPTEAERQIPGGLGVFVLRLDDGTEIYSPPEAGPFQGPVKPAAFLVDEAELGAIFDAVQPETPVFIY